MQERIFLLNQKITQQILDCHQWVVEGLLNSEILIVDISFMKAFKEIEQSIVTWSLSKPNHLIRQVRSNIISVFVSINSDRVSLRETIP